MGRRGNCFSLRYLCRGTASITMLYAQPGDKDRAFEWLEKAYQERSSGMSDLKVRPAFESLRPDPRCAALLRRIDLTL
jgi:hypothetical protein